MEDIESGYGEAGLERQEGRERTLLAGTAPKLSFAVDKAGTGESVEGKKKKNEGRET